MESMLDDMIENDGTTLSTVQKISSEFYNHVIGYVSKIRISKSNDNNNNSIQSSLPLDKRIRSLSEGDVEHTNLHSRCLGLSSSNVYMYIKKGKYGTYAEWVSETGETNRVSISKSVGNRPLENITYEEVLPFLEEGSNMVREISSDVSIRKSKKGDYVFFKTSKMKKPKFFALKGFEEDYKTCHMDVLKSWLKETFNI
jgi:DNA topoisomerase-1